MKQIEDNENGLCKVGRTLPTGENMYDSRILQDVLVSDCVTAVKSIAYSFRSTRETLDTALFTIRKFVFTVTLIHECS